MVRARGDADVKALQVLETCERQVVQFTAPWATLFPGGFFGLFQFVFDPAPEVAVAVAVRIEQFTEGEWVAMAIVDHLQVVADATAKAGLP
ncbi:hypothetical protein D3C76_772180 [compost metagenome]